MAKIETPNAAQTAALTEGAKTGFLPADTPNAKRTAQACVRRGWATEQDEAFPISDAGRVAIGAEPQDPAVDEVPGDELPVVDLRADETDEEPAAEVETVPADDLHATAAHIAEDFGGGTQLTAAIAEVLAEAPAVEVTRVPNSRIVRITPVEDAEPAAEVDGDEPTGVEQGEHPYDADAEAEEAVTAPAAEGDEPEGDEPEGDEPDGLEVPEVIREAVAKLEAGQLVVLTEGQRVYHRERIVGGCNGAGHAKGVLTGQQRTTQGRDHVQVKLDCGHVKWPLQRVLVVDAMPVEWLSEFVATAGERTGDLRGAQVAVEFYAMGLAAADAGAWVRAGFLPEKARPLIKNGQEPVGLAA